MGQEAAGVTGAHEVPSQYEKELCTVSLTENWNSLPRVCGIFFLGDIQTPPGHNPVQLALGELAEGES